MDAPTLCPKCRAPLAAGEKFCGKCGYQVQISAADARDIGARIGLKHEKQRHQQRIRSGRTTILWVAILTMIGSVAIYFLLTSQVDKNLEELRSAKGNPAYDQGKLAELETENRHARGIAVVLSGVNLVLALCYFGLWAWAKKRPLPATLAALILFITVQVASAVIEPTTVIQGIWVKVIIFLFLIKAVDSARKFQRMQEHGI